ncbi:MAG: DUF167 domain-containing protein [Candidatus Peribacteraceae bacterium]|jgi:hypothetical protein
MIEDLQETLQREGSVTLSLRVRPNAPESRLRGKMEDGSIKVDVAAPAEEGKANAALVKFLAGKFDVHASQVEVLAGGGNRRKLVRITR